MKSNDKILFMFCGKSDNSDYINNSHSILTLEHKTKCKRYSVYLKEISKFLKKNFTNLKFHILAFNLFGEDKDYEINNFSHKYLGNCNGRKNMEIMITRYIRRNIKNRNIEPIFDNLNKFLD